MLDRGPIVTAPTTTAVGRHEGLVVDLRGAEGQFRDVVVVPRSPPRSCTPRRGGSLRSQEVDLGERSGDLRRQLAGQEAEPADRRRPAARPQRPCRYAAHTAACAGSAPRASSPPVIPARTSPDPETPRPAPPLSSRQSRPSGAAIHEVDAAQPDDGPGPPRQLERGAGRVVVDLVLVDVQRVARSRSGSGVSTTRPSRWCRQASSAVTQASPSASRASGPRRCGSSRSPKAWVASVSAMPGPDEHGVGAPPPGRAPRRRRRRRCAPPSVSGRRAHQRLRQRCGGERRHRGDRRDLQLARAGPHAPPRRRAARRRGSRCCRRSPGSSRGRSCRRSGSGSGQPRSTSGVTQRGLRAAGAASGSFGDVLVLGDEVLDLVEVDEPEARRRRPARSG